jgi:hypothetical protein
VTSRNLQTLISKEFNLEPPNEEAENQSLMLGSVRESAEMSRLSDYVNKTIRKRPDYLSVEKTTN